MKRNLPRWLASIVVIGVFTLHGFAQAPTSTDTAQALELLRAKYNLPALAVVVVKDGEICDRAAVGLRKLGDPAPVTTNDVFHIGSCTKSMTATLAAILIEEGKLSWETTVSHIFPDLKGTMDRRYENVTLEQLLTHRGGVPHKPSSIAWMKVLEKEGTPTQQRSEFIASVLSEPPEAEPGTTMIYSNQGYVIVGAMLEKISGKPWEELITERLFAPLKMKSAGFGPPGTKDNVDQPWGHARQLFTLPIYVDNPPALGPAGTVHCSLDDLARYTMIHLQGERRGGLLKPETFRKLHTPPAGDGSAHGWLAVSRTWAGGKALTHSGSNNLWYLVMWLAPERNFAVMTATNIAGEDSRKGCDEVATAMIHKWLPK